MKIRPKNIIYASKGVLFSTGNEKGKNWREKVFEKYRQLLLEKLKKFGNRNDFGDWLNNMLSNHARIYKTSGGDNGLWEMETNYNPNVENYLKAYQGNTFNIDFNQYGIRPNQSTRYLIDGIRTSGDFQRDGFNYNADGLYSAITDDRRLLGRLGDWDEESLKEFNSELSQNGGWTMYLDNDGYYRLKRVGTSGVNTTSNTNTTNNSNSTNNGLPFPKNPVIKQQPVIPLPMEDWLKNEKGLLTVPTGHKEGGYKFDWNKLKTGFSNILNNPNIYSLGRLAGTLLSNDRIYDEALKGILPTLSLTYNTHRQVVGDEATKLAYYKRATLGETKAKRAITSDLDKQLAYLMEAKRIGDELRALGDLADNQEIRRTSDESNQHQWDNTKRATEVANANTASINQANSLRHNLLALKHSANWSSIDNFLLGIEYRKRQLLEKINAINDNLFTLQLKDFLDNDLEYWNAYNTWQKIVKENTDSTTGILENNETVRNARKAWNKALRDANRRLLQNLLNYNNLLFFAKSGTKVTYKKKDDLLYKSAKDTVEHFRKMSKLSSDALNRKRPKIEKLTSHPKGSTKKYLLGGVAPFVIYKPVALGGETITSSQASTSSTSKSSGGSDGLDLLKELFKSLQTEGLPSDVTGIYKAMQSLMLQKEAFGDELSTEDIASAYIYQMQLINNVKFSKALFDLVAKTVLEKDAGSEYAIDLSGRLAVQDGETKRVTYKLVNNMKEGDVPLTNSDLLNLRAVAFPFDNNMLQVASNATSMKEISEFLKAQLPKIESTESVIEGYTKKGSEDIKEGLRSLLQDAPEGDYKYTKTIKDNLQLRALALDYLYKILPKNMKNLLEVNANLQGSNSKTLIEEMINAGAVLNTKTEFDAVTGKAAKDSNGNSKGSGDLGDMIPAVAFFLGLGDQKTFIILDKTQDGLKIDTISAPITKDNKNTGIITLDKLSESDFGGLLLINLATIGDSLIALNGSSNVLIGDRIYLTELPIDKEYAQKTGIIRPNLNFLKRIEQANEKLKLMGIDTKDPKNIPTINKVYQDCNLPILYTISNNKPVLSSEYARFAMVNATVSEKAFAEEPNFNDGIREASKREREQFESTMKTFEGNSKYSIDDGWGPFDWGKENLYVGVVYIPMVDSTISALGGTGFKASGDEYNEILTLQQQANYARKMGFKPGGNESNLK